MNSFLPISICLVFLMTTKIRNDYTIILYTLKIESLYYNHITAQPKIRMQYLTLDLSQPYEDILQSIIKTPIIFQNPSHQQDVAESQLWSSEEVQNNSSRNLIVEKVDYQSLLSLPLFDQIAQKELDQQQNSLSELKRISLHREFQEQKIYSYLSDINLVMPKKNSKKKTLRMDSEQNYFSLMKERSIAKQISKPTKNNSQ